ncbi:MAG TPA: CARDB domain-containing protein [Candidatus Baltobacteraceae bacterium]|nr:CARDB domain-containing protein [Candidatus Baltobacteraceae bacterium]
METRNFFLMFALVAMLGSAAGATTLYDNALSLANVSVSPNPVVAGGNATISFQLYNSYDFWLYGTNLQPTGSYPLLNVSPLGDRIIGVVNPGFNSTHYTYTIAIPNTTPSGVYTLGLGATYTVYAATGTEVAASSMPVSFYVQNRPMIKVSPASPQPTALYSGYNQTLSLLVQNTGYGDARNVTVRVSGGQGLNLLSSVTTFFISNLTQGATVTEPLTVSAQGTGHPSLLANITYYSARLNQRFSSIQAINLSVAPSAQFSINSTGSSPGVGATDVPVHFRVTNIGTSPANELQLNLQTSYPITPVASTAYVGSLEPGATANVTFLVNIDTNGVPGSYPVTLYEQWKQPSGAINQQFTGSDNYYVAVGAAGGGIGSFIAYAILAIVVIVGGTFAYRRFIAKGKKKHDKKA